MEPVYNDNGELVGFYLYGEDFMCFINVDHPLLGGDLG